MTLPPHILSAPTPRMDAAFFNPAPMNRYVAVAKFHACQLERELIYACEVMQELQRKARAFDWLRNRSFDEIENVMLDKNGDGKTLLEAIETAMKETPQ